MSKIEVQNNSCINVFGYQDELAYPAFISEHKFEDSMDLLLLFEDDKSHYVYTSKIVTHLSFIKQKIKTKNGFVKVVYNALVMKKR